MDAANEDFSLVDHIQPFQFFASLLLPVPYDPLMCMLLYKTHGSVAVVESPLLILLECSGVSISFPFTTLNYCLEAFLPNLLKFACWFTGGK